MEKHKRPPQKIDGRVIDSNKSWINITRFDKVFNLNKRILLHRQILGLFSEELLIKLCPPFDGQEHWTQTTSQQSSLWRFKNGAVGSDEQEPIRYTVIAYEEEIYWFSGAGESEVESERREYVEAYGDLFVIGVH